MLNWQLTKPWELICEHTIAQHVMRWLPFYLTIWKLNETLFAPARWITVNLQ